MATADIFTQSSTGGDTVAFLGFGIVLSGASGTNPPESSLAAGDVSVIVAYNER